MEENIKYIPARLKNATKGGNVAGTDDIIDDESNKKQSLINREVNTSIQNIQDKIGDYIPKNRGEYEEGERYYKDNIVLYKGGSYIADPVDYDINTNSLAYVTVPPYDINPDLLNPGWRIFARGHDSSTSVSNVSWDNDRKAITQTIGSRTTDVVTIDVLKEEIGGVKITYNENEETLIIK